MTFLNLPTGTTKRFAKIEFSAIKLQSTVKVPEIPGGRPFIQNFQPALLEWEASDDSINIGGNSTLGA